MKHPRAHALASELAQRTGESLTAAVIRALEERLDREKRKKSGPRTAARILEFANRFARGAPPDFNSGSHADLLYGEDGLPR